MSLALSHWYNLKRIFLKLKFPTPIPFLLGFPTVSTTGQSLLPFPHHSPFAHREWGCGGGEDEMGLLQIFLYHELILAFSQRYMHSWKQLSLPLWRIYALLKTAVTSLVTHICIAENSCHFPCDTYMHCWKQLSLPLWHKCALLKTDVISLVSHICIANAYMYCWNGFHFTCDTYMYCWNGFQFPCVTYMHCWCLYALLEWFSFPLWCIYALLMHICIAEIAFISLVMHICIADAYMYCWNVFHFPFDMMVNDVRRMSHQKGMNQ